MSSEPPPRLEDLNFVGARLHSPDFEEARITDGHFAGAEISGFIEGLRVNGVEVEPLIRAELERRSPERAQLRATDPPGLAGGWVIVKSRWEATLARAQALPEELLHERVDFEWSFVETLRHLIFATDCWLRRMVFQMPHPYHPWGLAGTWLSDPASLGVDGAASPALKQVVQVRRQRQAEAAQTFANLTSDQLERICTPPDTPGHPNRPEPVRHCLQVILNEEWLHNEYAERDLGVLESRSG
ncbi:MAG TPA: DinB family protein [Candidatus Dormibacteraeota bacterium]|nr:DinB family protein [Candidatus Dormibacteraeota bacterium]